ncbi:MAG: sigma-70 family RNA polymerase sigma factor [Chloroflexota bacterium]
MSPHAERDLDDGLLLRRVAGGDEGAFMTLYDRHADALFGTTVRFLRDRESAAEVLQDVFVAIWQRADQFDPRFGSAFGWLVGIARNRAIDRLRAESRRPRAVHAWPGDSEAGDTLDLLDWAGRRRDSTLEYDPVAEVDRRWTRSLVRTTLAEMPAEERQVVVLAYDQALSQSEIAARLGMPIGTVKSRTRRALARLRAHLADVPDLRPGQPARTIDAAAPTSAEHDR